MPISRFAPLVLVACAPTALPDPDPTWTPPSAVVRWTAPAGAILGLDPVSASPGTTSDPVVDGWWREALRQSAHFDIAGGVEDCDTELRIELHWDRTAETLSSTLRRAGQPPLPLASQRGAPPAAIDALALATRQALGESPAERPAAAIALYSADRDGVALTERALEANASGDWDRALSLLRRARTRDPGCTITLAALARTLMILSHRADGLARVDEARRIAVEALTLTKRLAPTTRHRLAHLAIVARARAAGRAAAADRELLTLGDVAIRERPHDPHVALSRAVAWNLTARYGQSTPVLRQLARRWPRSGEVAYHRTFAELAQGQPEEALRSIRSATDILPEQSLVIPTALALFHTGQHDELRAWLEARAAKAGSTRPAHELRQMRAAHALLCDRREEAVTQLLEDLEWIRQRPSQFESLALSVAETGEVLVMIGEHDALKVPLQAFEDAGDPGPTFAQVLVYLGGMIQVASSGKRAEPTEAHLTQSGQTVWSSMVRAAAHRRRGELMDELNERVYQYQSTENPLARASLARVLRAGGSDENADRVLDELHERLLRFDLRRIHEHPLMRPAAALALLAVEQMR